MSDGDEFSKVMAWIELAADPRAAAGRLAELRQAATDSDKAAAKIEADGAAHEIKVAADKAEIAEERRRAASLWQTAQEAERKAAALMERAEAHAAKVGYWEKPTRIPIGESGIGMVVIDEVPALPPPTAPTHETVAEPFEGGRSGGRMVARMHRGRA